MSFVRAVRHGNQQAATRPQDAPEFVNRVEVALRRALVHRRIQICRSHAQTLTHLLSEAHKGRRPVHRQHRASKISMSTNARVPRHTVFLKILSDYVRQLAELYFLSPVLLRQELNLWHFRNSPVMARAR